jgi:hypothetical protein
MLNRAAFYINKIKIHHQALVAIQDLIIELKLQYQLNIKKQWVAL